MDSIFTEEKKINHQSMMKTHKKKKMMMMIMKKKNKGHHHNHEFVYNFVVYVLTAFLSSLFYFYLFCFPYSMSHFLFDFSFLLNSKFVFLLGNIIVIFLFVGESRTNKLGASSLLGLRNSSSPADEIYDEYMEIKRRTLIRQQTIDDEHKEKSQKVNDEDHKDEVRNNINYVRRNCSLNNIIDYQKKKKKMVMTMEGDRDRGLRRPRSIIVEHKDKKKEEDDKTLIIKHENENNVMSFDQEKISKETSLWVVNCCSMTRPKSLGRLDDIHDEICDHDNGDGNDHRGEDDVVSNNKTMKIKYREEKRKEMEKSMEELNRRVEDFIARVNKQRMLESTMD